tara:strand:- start:1109 stop:1288 length:180 start_codon:yes stop_codon:yes gene_type:complete
MPNNKNNQSKKTDKPRDKNGKYIANENAVVSRIGINEENPVPEKSGDKVTRHGCTIHYS